MKQSGYQPRFYRKDMGGSRFRSFVIKYKDSDLWVGVDPASYKKEMEAAAQSQLQKLRGELESYMLLHPAFGTSFEPVHLPADAPDIAKTMAQNSRAATTGPMAAVAGAISEYIGRFLLKEFAPKELVVENGGDLFIHLQKEAIFSVYAGDSKLSEKIGIKIPAGNMPIGLCTSAGTVGPSISFGKADAVVVAAKDTACADAFATAIGNEINSAADIERCLEYPKKYPELLLLLIICEDQLGVQGMFEIGPIA